MIETFNQQMFSILVSVPHLHMEPSTIGLHQPLLFTLLHPPLIHRGLGLSLMYLLQGMVLNQDIHPPMMVLIMMIQGHIVTPVTDQWKEIGLWIETGREIEIDLWIGKETEIEKGREIGIDLGIEREIGIDHWIETEKGREIEIDL